MVTGLVDPLRDPGARRYPVTRRFGDTSITSVGDFANLGAHTGIDRSAPRGTPVYAAAAGVVRRAGLVAGGGGRVVELVHSDSLQTRYAHLSVAAVRAGQAVAAGQYIGGVGATGAATGNHLHFEVLLDGRYVDPAPYLGLGLGSGATLADVAPGATLAGGLFGDCEGVMTVDEAVRTIPGARKVGADSIVVPPGTACPSPGWRAGVGPFLGNPYPGTDVCIRDCGGAFRNPGDVVSDAFRAGVEVLTTVGVNAAIVVGGAILVVAGIRQALRG